MLNGLCIFTNDDEIHHVYPPNDNYKPLFYYSVRRLFAKKKNIRFFFFFDTIYK